MVGCYYLLCVLQIYVCLLVKSWAFFQTGKRAISWKLQGNFRLRASRIDYHSLEPGSRLIWIFYFHKTSQQHRIIFYVYCTRKDCFYVIIPRYDHWNCDATCKDDVRIAWVDIFWNLEYWHTGTDSWYPWRETGGGSWYILYSTLFRMS
jgi:hypothetical protein